MTEHWLLTDFIYLNFVKYQIVPKLVCVYVIVTPNLAVKFSAIIVRYRWMQISLHPVEDIRYNSKRKQAQF